MSWSEAQKEAIARATTDEMWMWGVELRHSIFPAPLRFVQSVDDIPLVHEPNAPLDPGATINYLGLAFRFREPALDNEPDPTVRIEIDAVSGALQPLIRGASTTQEPVEATFRSFIYDGIEQEVTEMLSVLHLQLRETRVTSTTVSAVFGYTNPANQAFPDDYYDAQSNPGLF